MQSLDIADIAQRIESPYHLVPLVAIGSVEVNVVICAGPKAWHRSSSHDELALVLEGVMMLEGPTGRVIVNEGDMARVPARFGHAFSSGMRTTVVLFRQKDLPLELNGHRGEPAMAEEEIENPTRINFGTGVRRAAAFEWLLTGEVGPYETHSTRLRGTSEPYEARAGDVVVLVYRGVVQVAPADQGESREGEDEAGAAPIAEGEAPAIDGTAEGSRQDGTITVVGSQLLVVPAGTRVILSSERGATVVVLARQGAGLPRVAGAL